MERLKGDKLINFKDFENINNIKALVDSIEIPILLENIRFWLIRTESGLFYEEYVNNDFVALSWNEILSSDIKKANKDKDEKDSLYKVIAEEYNSKQPGMIFNKCDKFINEIKEGDIFMIPDKSNNEITFAVAGEYYEETNLTTTEAEFIAFKESGWLGTFEDKDCPYAKRRRIEILKRIPGEHINPNLFRALISYHGLSDINNYAGDILSSIYPIYFYDSKLSMVFQVMVKGKIDALSYSSFIYNSSKQINASGDLGQIGVKSNINSPGSIVLDLFIRNIDSIPDILPTIALIWIVLGGGKVFGIQFNSVIKTISEALNDHEQRRKTRAETKSLEIDNDFKEDPLKNKKMFEDLLKNTDPKALQEIASTAEPLDIDISELAKVINLEKYKNNRDS